MKHMRALNKKAGRIEEYVASQTEDVVAMQDRPSSQPQRPHVPPAEPPDSVSLWSAISTTVLSVATGRHRFPII
jgi:hypothetical protein